MVNKKFLLLLKGVFYKNRPKGRYVLNNMKNCVCNNHEKGDISHPKVVGAGNKEGDCSQSC